MPRRAPLSTVVSRSRAAHLPHPDTSQCLCDAPPLRYKASPSRCDDRRTSRSLSRATRHTLFGRLDLARVRGHVELAWAEAGDDVTVYPPFAVACGWPYSGQIAREQSLCRRCVTVYCAGVEYKGAKGRGKIGRARLPRTRASLLTGRTCDW